VRICEPEGPHLSLQQAARVFEDSDLRELLHTSSASRSVWWAGVRVPGRISKRRTTQPRSAACHAASQPASPPPMIVISGGVMGEEYVGKRLETSEEW